MVQTETDTTRLPIDPAVFETEDGRLWLVWGGGGVYLSELNPETGLLAKNPSDKSNNDFRHTKLASNPGDWIKGPYIYKNDDYYYLFVNFGACCNGVESNTEIRVGRSGKITGPYVDRSGNAMTEPGVGELLLGGEGRFIGPGHAGIHEKDDTYIFTYHFYDGEDEGKPKLGMTELEWINGWPVVQHATNYDLLWEKRSMALQ